MAMPRSRTLLALCKDVVSELGVAGGSLQSTSGLSNPEQQRIVNWVIAADVLIQTEWSDWNFLYYNDVGNLTLAQGTNTIAATTQPFDDIDRESMVFWWESQSPLPAYPKWLDWKRFAQIYLSRPIQIAATAPANWSVDPGGMIWFSQTANVNIPVRVAYWLPPTRMANDTDTSPIPAKFDRCIVERAKMLYAQRENATEILSGSSAEFNNLFEKLMSSCLPSGRAAFKSRNDQTTMPDGYID